MPTVNVIVADSTTESREYVTSLLESSPGVNITDHARDGREAFELVRTLQPEVLLVDANISGMESTQLVEQVVLENPGVGVIILSAASDMDLMRKVMRAGASDFLVKPVTQDDLVTSVTEVFHRVERTRQHMAAATTGDLGPKGHIITVYSPQGGSGKTVLAANLAVSLAQHCNGPVVLMDLNLQFGDVDLMLNLSPEYTIAGLAQKQGEIDADLTRSHLTDHESGLKVLVAPSTPQYAETITVYLVEQILDTLKEQFDYIIIDTPSLLQDTTLAALDVSDHILLLTTLDLLALHNTKTALEMLQQLYSPDKIKLILNRSNADVGITPEDVESTLGFRIAAYVPSDGRIVVTSVNEGHPFVLGHPEALISRRIVGLAYDLMGQQPPPDVGDDVVGAKKPRAPGAAGFFKRILLGE